MNFYVYIYLRKDGSPYYVGKGQNARWRQKSIGVEVPPADLVIFPVSQTTEEWAHFMEMELIDLYGRLNDGTGILENFTDGGEGCSGAIRSKAYKQNISKRNKGKIPWNKGKKLGPMSEEQKNKRKGKPSSFKGKHHSEDAKQKIKEKRANQVITDETKQKIGKAHKGSKRSEETKQKMSEAAKRRTPEQKERHRLACVERERLKKIARNSIMEIK